MADKKITVVIDGEEYVSKAADEAGTSLTLFGKRIPLVVDATKLLDMAMSGLRAAFDYAKQFVAGSIAAFDASEASQRKLQSTAKLLGVETSYLADIARKGREEFKLSEGVANEYAVEVAKLALNSGNAASAQELLGAFLDLGAAKGLTAQQSMQAVSQALLGIDEGTDKLFGKNPSGLWDDFSKVIGRSAGKFSDMDKAAALAYAALNDGEKVAGAFGAYLETAAGKQDVMNQRMADAQIVFGSALQPVRLMVLELGEKLLPVLGPLARLLGGSLAAVLIELTKITADFWSVIVGVVGALAKLTGDKSVVEWSQRQSDATKAFRSKLEDAGKAVGNVIKGIDDTTKQSTAVAKVENTKRIQLMDELVSAAKKRGESEAESLKKAEQEWKAYYKTVKETQDLVMETMIGYQEAAKRLAPEVKKALDPVHLDAFNKATQGARESADRLWASIKAGGEPSVTTAQRLESQIRLSGESLSSAAGNALDLAEKFGGADTEALSLLKSCKSVGDVVASLAKNGLSFAGVTGVIAGVGAIVSTMMQGDKERRELTRQNTEALNKLRTEGVRLSNKASGDQIAGIAALDPNLIGLLGQMTGDLQRANGNQILTRALAQAGLRLSDLDAVAGELGFNLRRDNGQIELSQLPLFFKSLQENMGQLTRIGQTFGEQLQFFRESQRITGASGMTQVSDLIAFLRDAGGASAFAGLDLSDPAKARQALFDLFTNLNNGGLGASALGRLTGEQFQQAILDLIGLIDGLKDDTGSAAASSSSPTTPTETVTAGGITMSSESIADVIRTTYEATARVLSESYDVQVRIAEATEGSYGELQVVNAQLRELIDITAGNVDRMNQSLADARALALANAGQGPSYG